MRIGILGSGNVGGALGKRWAQGGHEIVFGSRKPLSSEMQQLVGEAGGKASAASFREAVDASEVLLLSTPWEATRPLVEGLGLTGKLLIDATNPLLPSLTGIEYGTTTSGAEQVAAWSRGARVVKAFNSVGFNIMTNPVFDKARAVMFYCGDDADAKKMTLPLIEELGFDAVDAGPLAQARVLEPLAMLWISLAYFQGHGREIAFQFLRR